ncbi:hypothetical protein ACE3MS_06975 [Paenibacillus dendritiformis]|uniref:hypothetical protein n=1 Tax=Paenibacillus dendritiformis TaxID=130049 RepID=UPI003666D9B2
MRSAVILPAVHHLLNAKQRDGPVRTNLQMAGEINLFLQPRLQQKLHPLARPLLVLNIADQPFQQRRGIDRKIAAARYAVRILQHELPGLPQQLYPDAHRLVGILRQMSRRIPAQAGCQPVRICLGIDPGRDVCGGNPSCGTITPGQLGGRRGDRIDSPGQFLQAAAPVRLIRLACDGLEDIAAP